jgi:uncharacterized membrane protein YdbT with pleckstrin-like domain
VSYLRQILQPDERVLYESRLHWLIYLPGAVLLCGAVLIDVAGQYFFGSDATTRFIADIVAVVVGLLALIALADEWIRRKTTEIAVTDRRIIFKRGLIRRHTIEMNMDKIESVDVDQTVLGRLFNFGTIVIHGTGSDVEPLHRIEDPLRFRSYVTARP